MGLGSDHHWQKTLQKERQLLIVYLLMKSILSLKYSWLKSQELIKIWFDQISRSTYQFTGYMGTEKNMLKHHHRVQSAKWKCGKVYRTNHLLSLADKLQDKNKIRGETSSLKEIWKISSNSNRGLYLDPDLNKLSVRVFFVRNLRKLYTMYCTIERIDEFWVWIM